MGKQLPAYSIYNDGYYMGSVRAKDATSALILWLAYVPAVVFTPTDPRIDLAWIDTTAGGIMEASPSDSSY